MFDYAGMAVRPFVKITIPPWSGQLDAWGWADIGWFGLVIWREYVIDGAATTRPTGHARSLGAFAPDVQR